MLMKRALLASGVTWALSHRVLAQGILNKIEIKLDVVAALDLMIRTVRETIYSTDERRRQRGTEAAATIVQSMLVMASAADRLAAVFNRLVPNRLRPPAASRPRRSPSCADVLDAIDKYQNVAQPALRAAERAVQDLNPTFTLANVSVMDMTVEGLGDRAEVIETLQQLADDLRRDAALHPDFPMSAFGVSDLWGQKLSSLAERLRDTARQLGEAASPHPSTSPSAVPSR